MARYAVRLVESPPVVARMAGLQAGSRCEVIADAGGVAAALVAGLRAAGVDASAVEAASGEASAVIFLPGLDPGEDVDALLACAARGWEAAVAVAPRLSAGPGAFITVQDTGGDLGSTGRAPGRAWLGGLPGLVKTAGLEWPQAAVKAIDLEVGGQGPEAVAARVLEELLAGGPEQEIALPAGGGRWTLAAVATAPPAPVRRLGPSDVVLVSGGARGVTASCVVELAGQTQARFVLLGRTPLEPEPAAFAGIADEAGLKRAAMQAAKQEGRAISPRDLGRQVARVLADREVRQTLASIEAAGGQVRYAAADVRDREALRRELAATRAAWGPVTGLIHGAGVLADAWLHRKTRDQYDYVVGTKVDGLRALLEVTEADPLRVIALFSSVAGRTGNVGQSDYAMANEVLNKVAAAQAALRGPSCGVCSLGWGPWAGGMVTPGLKAHFEAQGVALIDVAAGAKACAQEVLGAGGGVVEVVLGGGVGSQGLHLGLPEGGAALELVVTRERLPWLGDHQIQGRVVLPVVQVLEWFARAASALRPGARLAAVQDLRVLRGVFLEELDGGGDRLILRATPAGEGGESLALRLEDGRGQARFSAVAPFGAGAPSLAPLRGAHQADDRKPEALYAPGGLFHGPAFQVIASLEGTGAEGARAQLVGSADRGWPGGAEMQTDPARVDGALQVALLWGVEHLGGQTLPLGIGAWRPFGRARGVARCEWILRRSDKQRTVSDARLLDAAGGVVAELEGVEMFRVPGGADRS